MRRNKPMIIGDLLTFFVKEHNLEEGFRQYRCRALWDEIVGHNIARLTVRKHLEGKKLYVYISSSVARSELYMHRSEIVKEINSRMGENIIDEIILK